MVTDGLLTGATCGPWRIQTGLISVQQYTVTMTAVDRWHGLHEELVVALGGREEVFKDDIVKTNNGTCLEGVFTRDVFSPCPLLSLL